MAAQFVVAGPNVKVQANETASDDVVRRVPQMVSIRGLKSFRYAELVGRHRAPSIGLPAVGKGRNLEGPVMAK